MKKLAYIMIIISASTVFTSCAKDEECVCDSGLTITEEDAKDTGSTLQEACDVAEISGSVSCEIE